ncbi:hypothetical protein MMC06_000305 [Schaereria dolodes]|nr:hypothetical protein [Schaereria dolodes]
MPINGCTASDFTSGSPCSIKCVNGLQVITTDLIVACQGTEADPSTLIGMFFIGKGISALCPNVAVSAVYESTSAILGGGGINTVATISSQHTVDSVTTSVEQTVDNMPTYTMTSTVVETDTTTILEPSPSTEESSPTTLESTASAQQSSTVTSISTSSTELPSATTITPSSTSETTITTPSSSTTAVATAAVTATQSSSSSTHVIISALSHTTATPAAFVKTAVNDGSATVITSKPDQTASPNPDAFGGGGSPFEISDGSISGAKVVDVTWVVLGFAISTALVWLY